MRDSIELGLEALADAHRWSGCSSRPVIVPASPPIWSPGCWRCAARFPASIVVPCCEGRRGHPLVLPWDLATLVPRLPAGIGVNGLASRLANRLVEMAVPNPDLLADLDTPDDLLRWNQRRASGTRSTADCVTLSPAGPPLACEKIYVQVRLFALAKERAGHSLIDLELPPAVAGDRRSSRGSGSNSPLSCHCSPTCLLPSMRNTPLMTDLSCRARESRSFLRSVVDPVAARWVGQRLRMDEKTRDRRGGARHLRPRSL